MIEIKNKKNPIVGYTGCMQSIERPGEEQQLGGEKGSHIPGYVGYIPSVKA